MLKIFKIHTIIFLAAMKVIDIFSEYICYFCERKADMFIILNGSAKFIPLCAFHSTLSFIDVETEKSEILPGGKRSVIEGEKNV